MDAPDPEIRPGDPIVQVLVVCHANIARSPLGMAMLEAEARRIRGPETPVWVRSAGTNARPDLPAAEGSVLEGRFRGLDLGSHRSRQLEADEIASADVILTMTERQRSWVVREVPSAARRTFTLPEMTRLVEGLDLEHHVDVRGRVAATVKAANRHRPFAPRPQGPEDVDDPFGGPAHRYQQMAETVDGLIHTVAKALFG